MRKANLFEMAEEETKSPSGKFHIFDKSMNEAIGGDSRSTDLTKRWPFAVELTRIPPGATNYPFHSHSTMYEFYFIVSGTATVRHKDGETEAVAGDFFIFGPHEPHQMINRGTMEVIYYSVADNPVGDHAYYPDSEKYIVFMPKKQFLTKGEEVGYYTGEDEAK